MRWKIQIEGDKKYFEDLCNVFNTLNFDPKIYKDDENYYLEGSIFEKSSDEKEISAITTTFLDLVPVIFNFKIERVIEPFKVIVIFDGERGFKYVFDPKKDFFHKVPIEDAVLKP